MVSLLIGFLLISFNSSTHLTISIAQFRLENIGLIFEFALVVFGASTYFSIDHLVRGESLRALFNAQAEALAADKLPSQNRIFDYRYQNFKAIYAAPHGFDIFDFVSSQIRIKIKFIVNNWKLARIVRFTEEDHVLGCHGAYKAATAVKTGQDGQSRRR